MADVKLTDRDRADLNDYLNSYAKKIPDKDIAEIEKKLDKKIGHLRKNKNLPSFIPLMIDQLKGLAFLLDSSIISENERSRVIAALHYFVWAEDRIPDYIPVIGYIDDAFVISVVYHDVKKYITQVKRSEGYLL